MIPAVVPDDGRDHPFEPRVQQLLLHATTDPMQRPLIAMKIYAAMVAILVPMLSGCILDQEYEFVSCTKDRKKIFVMTVPRGYQSGKPSKHETVSDSIPLEGVFDPATGFNKSNSGVSQVFLYATYPEFKPLGGAAWRSLLKEEGDPKKIGQIKFSSILFSKGKVPGEFLKRNMLDEKPDDYKNYIHRIKEDSEDGMFWVYPNLIDRYGPGKTSQFTYFIPKTSTGGYMIACPEWGKNSLPKYGHCFIYAEFSENPELSCWNVEFRIAAKDLARREEYEANIKNLIKGMLTSRVHGE